MAEDRKFVIFVQAGPQELARALHGLLYARELHEAGIPVRVVFDGAGTTWIREFGNPGHKYHGVYRQVADAGLIDGACAYCAGAFGVKEDIQSAGISLLDAAGGHPSLVRYVRDGWMPLIL